MKPSGAARALLQAVEGEGDVDVEEALRAIAGPDDLTPGEKSVLG